jgi:hypothetical protein
MFHIWNFNFSSNFDVFLCDLNIFVVVLCYGTVIVSVDKIVGWFMVFNATFNNISIISWLSVLLVEETGVPGENH